MKRKIFISLILFFLLTSFSFSLDFKVIPDDDGTIDLAIEHEWEYRSPKGEISGYYSSIRGEQENSQGNTETDTGFINESGTTKSLETDIVGYRMRRKGIRLDLAFNFQYRDMDIKQSGYFDVDSTRYFISNDRILKILFPRLKGKINYRQDEFQFSLGGEYAPWLLVDLNQELAISPEIAGSVEGLTDGVNFESNQSALNSFSLNSKIRYDGLWVTPQILLEYEYLHIIYDMLIASGELEVDDLTQVLSLDGELVLNFIKLDGLYPAVTFNYTWNWSSDPSDENSETILDKDFSIGFGFEL